MTRRLLVFLPAILLLAACVPNVPYRIKGYEDEPDLKKYADRSNLRASRQTCWVEISNGDLIHQEPPCDPGTGTDTVAITDTTESQRWRYHLSLIEFDDEGDFWLRKQLDEGFQCLVRELTGNGPRLSGVADLCQGQNVPEAPDRLGPRPAIVTLFIHGWKHNASPKNEDGRGNLKSFHRVLRRTAQGELARADRCKKTLDAGLDGDGCEPRPREIIGVYLGWRGKSSAKIPLLQEFTIFNRRSAAERVARVAASHTIHRVANWTKESNDESRMILVGHSLGAVILEDVFTRSATVWHEWAGGEEMADQPLPVDLVVLINSANDAILAKQAIDVFGPPAPRVYNRFNVEVPTVVSITSAGDTAVRRYFPIIQKIKTLFRRFRPGQRSLFTHTPGFSKDLRILSHELSENETGCADESSLENALHNSRPPPSVRLANELCSAPRQFYLG